MGGESVMSRFKRVENGKGYGFVLDREPAEEMRVPVLPGDEKADALVVQAEKTIDAKAILALPPEEQVHVYSRLSAQGRAEVIREAMKPETVVIEPDIFEPSDKDQRIAELQESNMAVLDENRRLRDKVRSLRQGQHEMHKAVVRCKEELEQRDKSNAALCADLQAANERVAFWNRSWEAMAEERDAEIERAHLLSESLAKCQQKLREVTAVQWEDLEDAKAMGWKVEHDAIVGALRNATDDESALVLRVVRKLMGEGRREYGPFVVATETRTVEQLREEEADEKADALVYGTMAEMVEEQGGAANAPNENPGSTAR